MYTHSTLCDFFFLFFWLPVKLRGLSYFNRCRQAFSLSFPSDPNVHFLPCKLTHMNRTISHCTRMFFILIKCCDFEVTLASFLGAWKDCTSALILCDSTMCYGGAVKLVNSYRWIYGNSIWRIWTQAFFLEASKSKWFRCFEVNRNTCVYSFSWRIYMLWVLSPWEAGVWCNGTCGFTLLSNLCNQFFLFIGNISDAFLTMLQWSWPTSITPPFIISIWLIIPV